MNKNSKIVIFGSRGLVGSAITRELKSQDFINIIESKRSDLDLMNQGDVLDFFEKEKPEYVFMAAAKVGGILANNTQRGDFIYENLTIQNNIFGAALKFTPTRLLFLGSSCIYPKNCTQPMKEEYLLTSKLEPTNEPYAIAKIAGLKMAQAIRSQYGHDFISVMPTNLYGPNDNFDKENSHVIPGLIARMTEAKKNKEPVFKCWGTGNPQREFLFVDDMAKACVFIMTQKGNKLPDWMNLGSGEEISIKNLVMLIKEIIDYSGEILFDTEKPDGTPRKLLDCKLINDLGWKANTNLEKGIRESVRYYHESI